MRQAMDSRGLKFVAHIVISRLGFTNEDDFVPQHSHGPWFVEEQERCKVQVLRVLSNITEDLHGTVKVFPVEALEARVLLHVLSWYK